MDDVKAPARRGTRPKISPEEIERRRAALRHADANNRLEGVFRAPATDQVFESHIHGEIDAAELLVRLKALSNNL